MHFHLIAIGGSIMHNLAIDLKDLGYKVTGSDDEIYEPARGNLAEHHLLPDQIGWDANRITSDISTIILGKHAKEDNPELLRARELGLEIMSFPQFVSSVTKATQRIAITGSHGKTTTTSMAMHVMMKLGLDFDYLVGARIVGFDKMVKMSGADILIVEGDEYPSSCMDNRAKMLHYDAGISVVTGIAWDHVNIYKTYEDYKRIFETYLEQRDHDDIVYFDQSDSDLLDLILENKYKCRRVGYYPFETNKKGEIIWEGKSYAISVFGQHNLKNLNAARLVCNDIGIETVDFLKAITDFTGAAKRLEIIYQTESKLIYKDFAHAPSKAKATSEAVRSKHPGSIVKGILELHTFSSLTMSFINHYKNSLDSIDEVRVFFDPHALEMKGLPSLDAEKIRLAFDHPNLEVISDSSNLGKYMADISNSNDQVVLIMSSGNLGGQDIMDHLEG